MAARLTTLHELIRRFELPRPDSEFPDLVTFLGEEARIRAAAGAVVSVETNAKYFYLLARAYELLGYSARHTPWLSNSPRFYWHKALGFLEEAMVLTPAESSYRAFLQGKLFFRRAMIFTLEMKATDPDNSADLLESAEAEFEVAAKHEPDATVRYLYRDAAKIAVTEGWQRSFRKKLQERVARARKWPTQQSLDAIAEHLATFPDQSFWRFPSADAGMDWPVQHAMAKARPLYAKAQMWEEVSRFLREQKELPGSEHLLREVERAIEQCNEEATAVCQPVGLVIRAADSRVTRLSRDAEAALRHCIREFRIAQGHDNEERMQLLARTRPISRFLPHDALTTLKNIHPHDPKPVRVSSAFVAAVGEAGIALDDKAKVFAESADMWIVRSLSDRYLVRSDAFPEIIDLHDQPIAFSHNEAQIFNQYATAIHKTCELYTLAIREILQVLHEANVWYERMTSQLEADTKAVSTDSHLASLHVTVSSILKEVNARNYPLLGTLRVRTRYAWSLLEMFQMRNQSIRLGTLFSGQCQLIMANPFFEPKEDVIEDQYLEVGADPIFQTTIDFVFRGLKGEEHRHDFQRRALRTARITIDQQKQSLLIESRYLDLDPQTRRALIARLACHRSLVLALEQFTTIFVAQRAGELPTPSIDGFLRDIQEQFSNARQALEATGAYPSRLINGAGLDALHDYMRGIAQVLIGMNARHDKQPWADIYSTALQLLNDARHKMANVGNVYLLPVGAVRTDYLYYMDARILTVSAFRSRYYGEEGDAATKAGDFANAAELFEKAADLYEKVHDYRVATKARARAADVRSLAESEPEAQYQWLKTANAYYAACGDASGYKDTSERLQNFPDEEAGISARRAWREPQLSPSPIEKFGGYDLQLLASGGMADVFRATGPDRRVVALKRIHADYLTDEDFMARFQNEFDTARSLSHPNIVQVYQRGIENGMPFFTMELLEGRTLEKAIDAHEVFAPYDAARIVKQVAEALDFAHAKGVVHRDLKPANVMIDEEGRVKVMDFGIAINSRFDRRTKEGTFLGTPRYTSPEQWKGATATPLSDLYALGLILYEMVTGKPVLPIGRRMVEVHPVPSAVVPDLPAEIDAIVVQLISYNPDARPKTAEVLIETIAAVEVMHRMHP
jgi:tRNA A-37 threonylcarbamoyl transferase component Bud32